MLIHITTTSGELVVVPGAASVVYVKVCPYLDHEFHTQDPRKKFCCASHSVMFCKKNKKS